jgi:hypothetical protein
MPPLASTRPVALRSLASFSLALALISLASPDASAQLFHFRRDYNRAFYGQDLSGPGYADSVGVRGHARLENGGYFGPPQIYSRQYGTIYGYRTDRPFVHLRRHFGTESGVSSIPSYH